MFTCSPKLDLLNWIHDDFNFREFKIDYFSILVPKDINGFNSANSKKNISISMFELDNVFYSLRRLESDPCFCTHEVSKFLITKEELIKKKYDTSLHKMSNRITEREKEILSSIGQSLSSKKIAKKLFVSQHTVESHKANICKKLGAKKNTELAIWAYKLGLIATK